MAPRRIHVAVLDTDVPCPSVYAQRGLYSSQFRVLLQAAAERINQNADYPQNGPLAVHVTAFDAVGGTLPPLESLRARPSSTDAHTGGPFGAIDAILITGSIASSYDPYPWIRDLQTFIQTVHADFPLVKMFGSCFGHQLIAQALLAEESADQSAQSTFHVERSEKGFEIGIQPISLEPSFTAHFPPLARASHQKPYLIQLIHGDVVVPTPRAAAAAAATGVTPSLPAPWMNVGSSALCAIQGLYSPGRVLTYQGHFEFDTFVNSELCREFARRSHWADSLVASYLEQIQRGFVPGKGEDDDSQAAAEAVVLFFAGEDQPRTGSGSGGVSTGLITPPLETVNA